MKTLGSLASAALLATACGSALAGCFVSASAISFGGYDVFDPVPRDSTFTVRLSCQESTARDVNVAVGPSATSGSIPSRQMGSGSGDRLIYNLFSDPSRTTLWGDGTAAPSVVVRGVSRSTPQNVLVYGRVPAGQDVRVGTYVDTITVTVDVVK